MEERIDYYIVYITAPDEDTAARIGRTLVEEKLIACANIVPGIRSIYRWKDAIEDEKEVLIIAKTREDLFEQVQARVKQLHPYEVPEIVAVSPAQGSREYLDWLTESTEA